MTRVIIRRAAELVACIAIVCAGFPAIAQCPDAMASDDGDAIIVTAHKREQDLREVAASVTVIGFDNIRETGKDGLADYINTVPGLSVASNGPGYSTFAIRGVTTGKVRQDEPQNQETVGLYLDDTPIAVNGFNPDVGLFDIARIEILRGPQGTLYGSGAMGGAIRLITNTPDARTISTVAEVTASSTRHGGMDHSIKGMANVPLITDAVAIRASAYSTYQSGYIDDVLTDSSNVNSNRTSGGRIQFAARIGPAIDARFLAMMQDMRTGALSEQFAPYTRGVRAFDGNSDHFELYSGTIDLALGSATLTSATSFVRKRNRNRISLEFLLDAALGIDAAIPLIDTTRVSDITQELRLASTNIERFEYLAGVFFQSHRRDYRQGAFVPGLDDLVGVPAQDFGTPGPDQIFYGSQAIDQTQVAGFGELSYSLARYFKATIGLRIFHFSQQYATYSSGLLNDGIDSSHGSTSDTGYNPKIELSYRPDQDRLYYLTVSRGYRLGGVNTTVPADLCGADLEELGSHRSDRFDPDNVWSTEVGARISGRSGAWLLQASGYYLKWQNIQTTLSLPSCFFSFRSNAGAARSLGLEVEGKFKPGPHTELSGSIGLVDARLTSDVPNASWNSGDRVPAVSPVQINLGIRQEFSLVPAMTSFARLDYSYVSATHTNFDRKSASDRNINGHGLLNLAVGTQLRQDKRLSIQIFFRNLTGSHGLVAAGAENRVSPERYTTVRPRTIGFDFRTEY